MFLFKNLICRLGVTTSFQSRTETFKALAKTDGSPSKYPDAYPDSSKALIKFQN